MKFHLFSCIAILSACLPATGAEAISIHSPNQQLHVKAGLDDSGAFLYADVKPDFLPPGTYQATIVQDGEDGHYQKNRETHRVEKRQAGPADTLRLKLAPSGGACVMLEKSTAP